jgi:hypothetical protein
MVGLGKVHVKPALEKYIGSDNDGLFYEDDDEDNDEDDDDNDEQEKVAKVEKHAHEKQKKGGR